jgi:hypothetical protein
MQIPENKILPARSKHVSRPLSPMPFAPCCRYPWRAAVRVAEAHDFCKTNPILRLYSRYLGLRAPRIPLCGSWVRWVPFPGVSQSRIASSFERAGSAINSAVDDQAIRTLEAAGIEFIEENGGGPGVRLRGRPVLRRVHPCRPGQRLCALPPRPLLLPADARAACPGVSSIRAEALEPAFCFRCRTTSRSTTFSLRNHR